jgi:hypothetical protein
LRDEYGGVMSVLFQPYSNFIDRAIGVLWLALILYYPTLLVAQNSDQYCGDEEARKIFQVWVKYQYPQADKKGLRKKFAEMQYIGEFLSVQKTSLQRRQLVYSASSDSARSRRYNRTQSENSFAIHQPHWI